MMQGKHGARIGIYASGALELTDNFTGPWRIVYQQGHLPDPGAMPQVYKSYAPAPVTIDGRGVSVRRQGYVGLARPIVANFAQLLNGIPPTAGQFHMQGLATDPGNSGDVAKGAA